MKKLFAALFLLTILILPNLALAQTASTSQTLSEESTQEFPSSYFVKAKGRTSVYLVSQGMRVYVPRSFVKKMSADEKRNILKISFKELSDMPFAKYMRAENSPSMYFVQSNRKRLMGKNNVIQNKDVVFMPDNLFASYSDMTSSVLTELFVDDAHKDIMMGGLALNNKNQVVIRDILWDNGTITPLGDLDKYNIGALDINDSGQIVGGISLKDADDDPRPFLWEKGKLTYLGGSNFYGTAFGINNKGQIVGERAGAGGAWVKAFLWDKGKVTDLGMLGNIGANAYDINENGQIVGRSETSEGEGHSHSFIWENGKMKDLGTFGGDQSFPLAMNNAGQVIGMASGIPASEQDSAPSYPFLWENGELKKLEDLNVVDINNSGQIIGDPRGGEITESVVWRDGKFMNLSSLIFTPSNWKLSANVRAYASPYSPIAINDNGVLLVLANMKTPHLFLYTLSPLNF